MQENVPILVCLSEIEKNDFFPPQVLDEIQELSSQIRFVDALYWAVYTVTTVGYGDVPPVTQIGKVLSIFTMIAGSFLFFCFTALFAKVLIADELYDIEKEVHKIEDHLAEGHKEESQQADSHKRAA